MSLIDAIQGLNFFNSDGTSRTNATGLSSGNGANATQSIDSVLKNLSQEKVEEASQSQIAQLTSGATDSSRSIFAEVDSPTTAQSGNSSFVNTLSDFIDSVDAKAKAADQANSDILSGKSDNIHQAMISMQEASISFDLLVQVRNKLVDAYKELSKMTV
jgi:flagellar hook-basal body complex protein FliE